jgi:hypothetical protein
MLDEVLPHGPHASVTLWRVPQHYIKKYILIIPFRIEE